MNVDPPPITSWRTRPNTTRGRCRSEQPEKWANVETILKSVRASGHYQKGSFRVDFAEEKENEENA